MIIICIRIAKAQKLKVETFSLHNTKQALHHTKHYRSKISLKIRLYPIAY